MSICSGGETGGEVAGDQQQHHFMPFDIELVIRCLENALLADERTTSLAHYIEAFGELKKLFSKLGVVFSFVEADLGHKHGILAQLHASDPTNYASIEQMLLYECFESQQQQKDNDANNASPTPNSDNLCAAKAQPIITPKAAGSRTLLRLHRSLAFLLRFVELIRFSASESTSALFRLAYAETLSKHHTWLIRASVQVASAMVPRRGELIATIFCQSSKTVEAATNGGREKEQQPAEDEEIIISQENVDAVAERFLQVTRSAYDRVQELYARHDLLELP